MKEVNLDELLKSELVNIEENNDKKLKITFKVTASEPLVFKFNNNVTAITEHYDIYEIALHVLFPAIKLEYSVKNVGTDNKEIPTGEYLIDIDTLGFSDYDEFKQFLTKYPTYIRYLEFVYRLVSMRPWSFLLYISTLMYKHDIKLSQNAIEITVEKLRISNFLGKYNFKENITFRILNRNNYAVLSVANISLVDFGISMMYNDFIKILEEKPEPVINTLIMLIISLLD
jgi:hypothetical protein